MRIFDEITKEEIFDPDLEKGFLYDGIIETREEESEEVLLNGTTTEDNPRGLYAVYPKKEIFEECKYYRKYPIQSSLNLEDYATWKDLADAYKNGVELA